MESLDPIVVPGLRSDRGMTKKTGELPSKAGVRSLGKKLDNTRHGFEQHPGASKTPGAFGKEERLRSDRNDDTAETTDDDRT